MYRNGKAKGFFKVDLPSSRIALCPSTLHRWGLQLKVSSISAAFCAVISNSKASLQTAIRKKSAEMEQTFNCKPQRWSVDGQRAIRLDGRSTLKNPFAFPAQPIFKVYGDSGGELYVGEEKITIHSIKDYVLLNCETHNAYNASGFCNETILSDDFPELPEAL